MKKIPLFNIEMEIIKVNQMEILNQRTKLLYWKSM